MRFPPLLTFLAFSLSLSLAAQESPPSPTVKKVAENFAGQLWVPSQWNNVSANVSSDSDKAPGTNSDKSMKVEVKFSASGDFEHFDINPVKPLYLPGDVKSITMRVKRNDDRIGVKMNFLDGWGRNKDLGWQATLNPGSDWQTVTFEVPKEWVRPVAIAGIVTHNYNLRGTQANASFWLDDIEVETDLSQVDPATGALRTWTTEPNPADKDKALKQVPATPLFTASFSTGEQANVFSSTPPKVLLKIQNWNPGVLTGKASFTVTDQDGTQIKSWDQDLKVDSTGNYEFPIEVKRYGLYTVKVAAALAGGMNLEKQLTFAKVPVLPELNEAQKIKSPYGLNYHGGGDRFFTAFKKAGFIWYRDYAFGLDTMRSARGNDRKYAGWPYFPAILQDYQDHGLIVVPILHAIMQPEMKDWKITRTGPDLAWVRDIADIMITFPSVHYWELSNEYDLQKNNYEVEHMANWENYNLYHKKFAELAQILGDGSITVVENGRGGIYPVYEDQFVKSGAFATAGGVLNSHYYTGTEAPETSFENFNIGNMMDEGRIKGSFFDALRAVKRVAISGGKNYQSWLTEFGWDTKAGPIVSNEQQAAYLQRGFLLAFASGTDKAFWFYNFDAEKGIQFFDGCGLITHDYQPKLAFAAMAGLSSILPLPVYVGSINVGPDTCGYVFENEGKLVAGLWTVKGVSGPKVTFKAEQLYDYLGNKLDGLSATLKIAPVYATGFSKDDPLYLQTAYSLESNQMIIVTAGDPAEAIIGLNNNRGREIKGTIKMALPTGWTSDSKEASMTAAPGARQEVKIPFTVGADEKLGIKEVVFSVEENGKVIKSFPLVVNVQRPFRLDVHSLTGMPGKASVDIQIENKSASAQTGQLMLKLPQGWEAPVSELAVTDLKPGEIRNQKMDIVWKAEWKENESATVVFKSDKNNVTEKSIIPNQYVLNKAPKLTMDGDLKDWPEKLQLPDWMLGSTLGDPQARLWMGWTSEGFYGAVEVHRSKAQVQDPRSFWGGDVLELHLSNNDKKDEFGTGDQQFWFVPIFKDNRVYGGQWKVKEEIPAVRYDIPEIKGFSRLTPDGYVMEFFVPAGVFQKYGIAPGTNIRLNANLAVRGPDFDREVYWPSKKGGDLNTKPGTWGRLKVKE